MSRNRPVRHDGLPVAEVDGPARQVRLLVDHRRDLVAGALGRVSRILSAVFAPRSPLAALSARPGMPIQRLVPPPCQERSGSRIPSPKIHETRPSLRRCAPTAISIFGPRRSSRRCAGAAALGAPFGVWAAAGVAEPDPVAAAKALAGERVIGLQLPATAMAEPAAL